MRSLCILIVNLSVNVNSLKPFGVATETQQCVHSVFLLLTCTRQQCKTFRGCHGNVTMRSLCILTDDLSVAVYSVKPFGFATETQQCVHSILLLTCMAVNNVNPFGVAMKTQQCLHSVFLLLTRVAADSVKLFVVIMETQQCAHSVLLSLNCLSPSTV
jgi:hypothetical protein